MKKSDGIKYFSFSIEKVVLKKFKKCFFQNVCEPCLYRTVFSKVRSFRSTAIWIKAPKLFSDAKYGFSLKYIAMTSQVRRTYLKNALLPHLSGRVVHVVLLGSFSGSEVTAWNVLERHSCCLCGPRKRRL